MRRVIGAEHIDDALLDAAPDAVAVAGVAHRRIHLGAGAEPLIGLGARKREMMRRRLAGGDILVVAQVFDFLLGRDVQHMDAPAGLARQRHKALRRDQGRVLVAPHRMRARIALDAQMLALVEAVFVLGMKRGAAADHLEDAPQAVVILHQQRAGG